MEETVAAAIDRSCRVPCAVCRGECRDKTAFDKGQRDFYFYLTVFIPGKNLSGLYKKSESYKRNLYGELNKST
jgi:hypothetical protein